MHLNAEKVLVRLELRHLQQGLSHAEADFQNQGSLAPEHLGKIRCALLHRQTLFGPVRVVSLLLAGGHAPAAYHETADTAKVLRIVVRHPGLQERSESSGSGMIETGPPLGKAKAARRALNRGTAGWCNRTH